MTVPFSGSTVTASCTSCDTLKGQLINELRTAANNISVNQTAWTVSQELKRIANVLDGAACGSVPVPPSPLPTMPTAPAVTKTEISNAVEMTKWALDRQPSEPTAADAMEVLVHVLRFQTTPMRSMLAPPGYIECHPGCPAEHLQGHTHRDGRIHYS